MQPFRGWGLGPFASRREGPRFPRQQTLTSIFPRRDENLAKFSLTASCPHPQRGRCSVSKLTSPSVTQRDRLTQPMGCADPCRVSPSLPSSDRRISSFLAHVLQAPRGRPQPGAGGRGRAGPAEGAVAPARSRLCQKRQEAETGGTDQDDHPERSSVTPTPLTLLPGETDFCSQSLRILLQLRLHFLIYCRDRGAFFM